MLRENQSELRYIDWNNLRYALQWVYEGPPSVRPKAQVVRHRFPGLAAWLITKGSVDISGDGVQFTAGPGEWVFPPFKSDRRQFSDDLEILSLRFEATWGGDNELYQEAAPHRCQSSDCPKLEQAARKLLRVAGQRMVESKNSMQFYPVNIHKHLRVHQTFLNWMQQYIATMDQLGVHPHQVQIVDERVRDACNYLDTLGFEITFREKALAEFVGISVAQLNRVFVKDLGVTPTAYLNERKLRAATQALVNTSAPIKQIAYELGFSDPAHFTNWFQHRAHHTPKEYRRLAMQSQ